VTEYIFSNSSSLNDNWFFDDNVSFEGNDSTFYSANGSFINDTLELRLDNNGLNGASFKSVDFYGHGTYEVRIKPADMCGLVSSFFLFQDFVDLSQYWNEILGTEGELQLEDVKDELFEE
jgi:beta-glucanase (GH16 family)